MRTLRTALAFTLVGCAKATIHTCGSSTRVQCLNKPGCRWFSYLSNGGCPLCEAWFEPHESVTGCHEWKPDAYCNDIIYKHAHSHYDGNPSDSAFREVVSHYEIEEGKDDPSDPFLKVRRCSVFCDLTYPGACVGQPKAKDEVKGVNYGGRFVPEAYLGLKGYHELYHDVHHPTTAAGRHVEWNSLCDIAVKPDAHKRMADFLDTSIQREHFLQIANSGFNVVRLPVGYWNFIDLPGEFTPNVPGFQAHRWLRLQKMMSAKEYRKWIDRVFEYANATGLTVLLDFHAAPGGQAGNAFTGCDMGFGNQFFDTRFNRHLAVSAVEAMARTCKAHGDTCYGIELLNEPSGSISRGFLKEFYLGAIAAARKHLPKTKPLIVMEWTQFLHLWYAWKPFSYKHHGRILFSTHLYVMHHLGSQSAARAAYSADLKRIRRFSTGRYDIMVTEWAMQNHGTATPADPFDFNSFAHFMVHQMNEYSIGSAVWNYDSFMRRWGPVAEVNLGTHPVDWKDIFQTRQTRTETATVVANPWNVLNPWPIFLQ